MGLVTRSVFGRNLFSGLSGLGEYLNGLLIRGEEDGRFIADGTDAFRVLHALHRLAGLTGLTLLDPLLSEWTEIEFSPFSQFFISASWIA